MNKNNLKVIIFIFTLVGFYFCLQGISYSVTTQECLMCHSQKDLTKKTKDGRTISLFTDLAILKKSTHGKFECISCHSDIKEVPHQEKLKTVECEKCHATAVDSYKNSVHSAELVKIGLTPVGCSGCHGVHDIKKKDASSGHQRCQKCHSETYMSYSNSLHGKALLKGDTDAPVCIDCHKSHDILSKKDPKSPVYRLNVAHTCAVCHADPKIVERRQITLPTPYQFYEKSVHGRAIVQKGIAMAAVCSDCHESHGLKRMSDPASSIYKTNVPRTCSKCHFGIYKVYQESIHGKALGRGIMDSPTCIDCHGEHTIKAPGEPTSAEYSALISRESCQRCHGDERIAARYGIPTDRLKSYLSSYHGLAFKAGYYVAANCISCHGSHDILPSIDPRSLVHKNNLTQTCGKCHPGVTENVARGSIHLQPSKEKDVAVYYTRLIYLFLIGSIIGIMFLHNSVIVFKYIRDKFREEKDGRYVVRFTINEIIQHMILSITFTLLVITGFAIKFPESIWAELLARLGMSEFVRGIIHRISAVALIILSFYHAGYLFLTKRGRCELSALLPRIKDLKDALQNLKYHISGGEHPKYDRYDYTEKGEYWALVWGTIIMVMTGLILWFPEIAMKYFPKWIIDVAETVHYYEAWLATLAIIVWHMFYAIYHPEDYPLSLSWLTGRMLESEYKKRHPLEYERIKAKKG